MKFLDKYGRKLKKLENPELFVGDYKFENISDCITLVGSFKQICDGQSSNTNPGIKNDNSLSGH